MTEEQPPENKNHHAKQEQPANSALQASLPASGTLHHSTHWNFGIVGAREFVSKVCKFRWPKTLERTARSNNNCRHAKTNIENDLAQMRSSLRSVFLLRVSVSPW